MSLIQQSKRDAKRKRSGSSEPLPSWAYDDKGAPLVVASGDAPVKPATIATAPRKTAPAKTKSAQTQTSPEVRYLRVDQLVANPFQPRRHFNQQELEELASSLLEHGQLQPVLVRPKGSGFQIIAGERRWRAAKLLPDFQLLCVVRTMNDMEALVASHHENHARVSVRSFDNALFFARYGLLLLGYNATQIDKTLKSGEMPEEFPFDAVSQAVGMSPRSVRRYTDLLRLSKTNRDWFDRAASEAGGQEDAPAFVPTEKHGRALLLLRDHPKAQKQLREEIEAKRLSGDEALSREKELRPKIVVANPGGAEAQNNGEVEPTGSKSKKKATPVEMLQGAVFLVEQVRDALNAGELNQEQREALAPTTRKLRAVLTRLPH